MPTSRALRKGSTALVVVMSPLSAASQQVVAPASESAQAAPTDSSGLGEIIVTARRRTESQQSVPVSVTSFSAEALEQRNIRNITQIGAVTPSVSISQAGYSPLSTVVSIRGQRTSDITLGQTPSVGIYIDDVYRSTTNGLAAAGFADATNVEVLKGPQGTLYGRNTTGGAIKVTTALPDYDEVSGRLKVGLGTYGERTAFGGVSVPLIHDKVAFRITGYGERNHGFGRDRDNNQNLGDLRTYAFTGTLRAKPVERLEAILRVGYNKSLSGGAIDGLSYIQPFGTLNLVGALQNGFITPAQLGEIFAGAPTPATQAAVGAALADLNSKYVAPRSYNKFYSQKTSAMTTQTSASATLNYEIFDDATLKSITSYQRFGFRAIEDIDGSPIVVLQGEGDAQKTKQYTQELQLAGTAFDKKLTYALGYFYYHLNGTDVANVTIIPAFGQPTLNNRARVIDTSHSGYLQASYEVVPTLNFTGGIRYTKEDTKAEVANTSNSGAICQVPLADRIGGACFAVYKNKFTNWSYTAGVDWKPESDILVYAKTSRGFKAGGQNIGGNVSGGYNSFLPETVTDYEVGFKSEFFDRAARLNVSAFHSLYNDIQRVVFVPGFGNSVNLATLNAATAKIDGAEAELTVRPVRPLTFGLSGSWTRPHYSKFIDPTTGADRSREKFAGVPKWLASAYVTLEQPTSFGSVLATLDAAYQSSVDFSPGNHQTADLARFTTQSGYTLFNARLAAHFERQILDVAIYGRNLANKRYFINGLDYTASGLGFTIDTLGSRRTVGVEISKRF